jgi:hypothetical protein
MLSVEIRSCAPGRCIWCGKEKDVVVTLSFSDRSFSGPMCFADFKKALQMKVGGPEDRKPLASSPVPTPIAGISGTAK